ncbi:hypothetical protein [Actinomadura craniellae]|uniref:hypothetical protein n=1 Tax=Actinomadura craniellae TaxID=2231787 RepID=UPI0011BF356A|nr:hypothetical protein [Actinomadura craniellae]
MGRLSVLIPALVLAAAACSSPEPAAPPPGHVLYRGAGYTFTHPAGWTERRTTDERRSPLIELHGPPGPHGAFRGQVIVARRDRYTGTMRDQLLQARAFNTVYGRQILTDRPHRVPGATEAHWIEAVYEERLPGGGTVQVKIVDIYALTPKGTMLNIAVRAPSAEFAVAGLPAVLRSVRVAS